MDGGLAGGLPAPHICGAEEGRHKEMEHMPNPFRTLTTRSFATTAALALGLGLFAGFGPASAASIHTGIGLASPNLKVEDVGYKRKYRQLYTYDYVAPDSGYRSYRAVPYGGDDEIRELQRFHPETLWPPSMRYFPYR
jgi:hypothetical protein